MGDPKAETRFRREIQALGRVEHPHLVKIFTSGSDGDQWFYTMELIEGADLGSVCTKLGGTTSANLSREDWDRAVSTAVNEARRSEQPLSADRKIEQRVPIGAVESGERAAALATAGHIQQVVELVRQVALAAQALHEAGVVHRDIKPGNIMVIPGTQHAVLMDLGLAQLADESEGRLTRTRQFVGTLRYASPEQVLAAGKLDRRSDVYSLGATLYELLTLRPLFGATEETPTHELMLKIQSAEPERPSRVNPHIPRDLEAVVLKCLEKDPARRYGSARELAQDFSNWERGDPVTAQPATLRYLLGKYVRRNRLRIGVAAAVLLAAVIGTVFEFYRIDRDRRQAIASRREAIEARQAAELAREDALRRETEVRQEKERTEVALKDAKVQRERADEERGRAEENFRQAREQRDLAKARFRMAREAVDQYYTRVSGNPELKSKGLEKLRTELLQSAAAFYDKFVQEAGDDPEVQAERGRALRRLGDLYEGTGQRSQAERAYEESLKTFARLSGDFPKDPRYKHELARTHHQEGELHDHAKRHDESRNSFHAAINLLRPLVNAYPNVPEYQADLVESLNDLGAWAWRERDEAWKEGTALARRLVAAHRGDDRWNRRLLATLLENVGWDCDFHHNHDAIAWYEEALRVARGLGESYPEDPDVRDCLSSVTIGLGEAYQKWGQLERAEPLLQESLALARRNATEHPLVPKLQDGLLYRYKSLGKFYLLLDTKRSPAAEKTIEEGLAFAKQLISTHPQNVETGDFKREAAELVDSLAVIRSRTGRPAEAVTAEKEAIAFLEQAGEQSPSFVFDERRLDILYGNLLKFLRKTHQDDLADAAVSEEVDYVVKLAEKHPESEPAWWIIPTLERVVSEIKTPQKGTNLFRQAVGPGERRLKRLKAKLGPNHPDTLASWRNLAQTYLSTMVYQVWLGQDKEYTDACRRALELAKGSEDPLTLEWCAEACSFPVGGDTAHLAESLTLARQAAKLRKNQRSLQMVLGICEFRNGHWTEAEEALSVAMKSGQRTQQWLTSAFYRAMNSFRRGKPDEARRLAKEAASKMKPYPQELKPPWWDVIVWMAHKEAKELLKLESTSPSTGQRAEK